MEKTPTTQDLDILATDIARDGANRHSSRLEQVAAIVDQSRLFPGSTAILNDRDAATVQTERALLTLRRHWHQITLAAAEWNRFSESFGALAEQWNRHQELRATGNVAALWQSRSQLDALRLEAATHSVQR